MCFDLHQKWCIHYFCMILLPIRIICTLVPSHPHAPIKIPIFSFGWSFGEDLQGFVIASPAECLASRRTRYIICSFDLLKHLHWIVIYIQLLLCRAAITVSFWNYSFFSHFLRDGRILRIAVLSFPAVEELWKYSSSFYTTVPFLYCWRICQFPLCDSNTQLPQEQNHIFHFEGN